MPSGWFSCNLYAISKDNAPQGFVLFVQFVFSKIKRQILLDSNSLDISLIQKTKLLFGRPIILIGATKSNFVFALCKFPVVNSLEGVRNRDKPRGWCHSSTLNPKASTALTTSSFSGFPETMVSPEARSMLTSVTPATLRMAFSALPLQWLHFRPLMCKVSISGCAV